MVKTARSLNFKLLLRDSLAAVKPIYLPLLILSSPSLLASFVNIFLEKGTLLSNLAGLVYFVLITPWFAGAAILYIYRYLTQQSIHVLQALRLILPKLPQLILGLILLLLILVPGFVLFVLPGIYLGVRFGFTLYAIAIENLSALDGLTRSWELIKGRWWSVFWIELLGSLVFFFPIGVISVYLSETYGAEAIATQATNAVLGFLVTPALGLYFVLLYLQLRAIASSPEDEFSETQGT